MAIRATYHSGGVVRKGVYLRIERIWGSKNEGWSAWVNVMTNPLDPGSKVDTFAASTEFVDGENPYPALYNKIRAMHFLADVVDDHDFQAPKEGPVKVVVEPSLAQVVIPVETEEESRASWEAIDAPVVPEKKPESKKLKVPLLKRRR